MDLELKMDSIEVYATKRAEAVGRKAMLEQLLVDKQKEQAAELLTIQTNITYWQTQIDYANKFLAKLNAESSVAA